MVNNKLKKLKSDIEEIIEVSNLIFESYNLISSESYMYEYPIDYNDILQRIGKEEYSKYTINDIFDLYRIINLEISDSNKLLIVELYTEYIKLNKILERKDLSQEMTNKVIKIYTEIKNSFKKIGINFNDISNSTIKKSNINSKNLEQLKKKSYLI